MADELPTTYWGTAKALVKDPEFRTKLLAMSAVFAAIGIGSTLYLRKRRKSRR